MSVDLGEFLTAYVAEVEELLASANAKLLVVEEAGRGGAASPLALREVFRALHTIKGLSAMVAVEPIVAIAHRAEAVLRTADAAGGRLPTRAVDVLLEAVAAIEARIRVVAAGRPAAAPPPALLARLDGLEAVDPEQPPRPGGAIRLDAVLAAKLGPTERGLLIGAAAVGKRARRLAFVPSPARAAAGMTINTVRERVGAVSEIVKVLPVSMPPTELAPGGLAFVMLVITDASDETLAAACGIEPAGVEPLFDEAPVDEEEGAAVLEEDPETPLVTAREPLGDVEQRWNLLRVDVTQIDAVMDLVSSLVVTRSRLARAISRLAEQGVDTRELKQVATDHGRQLKDLRAAVLQVRMVPVTDVLDRVPLIVRGLMRSSGKEVRLEIEAGTAELDKSVAERVFPAIVHLVRNAVDHGLESPEARVRAGKSREGHLRIVCSSSASRRLDLTVEDDGAGIDRGAVAARAGAPVPETDAALLELLSRPGLSTAAQVTTTSGRGMGMDIVERVVVHQLGGQLELSTVPGKGTRFHLQIPLTVAIVDVFVIECAGRRFVTPVPAVEEILEIDPELASRAPGPGGRSLALVQRRGETMPLADLATALGLRREGPPARRAVVVRRANEPVAFLVDRVVAQQEAVVRPLVDPLVRVRGVPGATDLGDGRPTLLLDLPSLARPVGPRELPGRAPLPLLPPGRAGAA